MDDSDCRHLDVLLAALAELPNACCLAMRDAAAAGAP
jgi:hypothetical protein